jgi:sigma-B regulation protein RsbU (phosphoserine phosphatase)
VLAAPGEAAALLDITPGILIGVDDDPRRESTTVRIPDRAILCFYTDGLIDRPDGAIDENIVRLCKAVTPEAPDVVCATVMAALVGRETVRDDVALLALRRSR